MHEMLAIAGGGFLGAIIRYLISYFIISDFPYATLLSNTIGSFLIGLVLIISLEFFTASITFRLFFAVGMMGALTTFSTFTLETLQLLSSGKYLLVLYYFVGSPVLGITFAFLGVNCAKYIIQKHKVAEQEEVS